MQNCPLVTCGQHPVLRWTPAECQHCMWCDQSKRNAPVQRQLQVNPAVQCHVCQSYGSCQTVWKHARVSQNRRILYSSISTVNVSLEMPLLAFLFTSAAFLQRTLTPLSARAELCDLIRSHQQSGARGGGYLHWGCLHWGAPWCTAIIPTVHKMTPLWAGALFCSKSDSVFWCRLIAGMGVPGLYTSGGSWLFWKLVLPSWVKSNRKYYLVLPSNTYNNLPCVLVSFCLC